MKRTMTACMVGGLAMLTPLSAQATPPPPPDIPSPARCPATPPIEEDTNERKGPLPIPPRLAAVARSSRTNLAVWTLGNANFCQAIVNISQAENFTLSPDARFLSFDWYGYEEGGHIVIDRSGRGQAVDTGAKPVFSPSGRMMAAVEYSESGFGSLNGFAIWQVNAVGLRRIVMIDTIPSLVDWRIDSWAGKTCVNLSGVPNSRVPESGDTSKVARDRYAARRAGATWRITRARC
jgi:hypothetical protein